MAKLKLEVGKTYENRFGKKVTIKHRIDSSMLKGNDERIYFNNGEDAAAQKSWDLVKEVKNVEA